MLVITVDINYVYVYKEFKNVCTFDRYSAINLVGEGACNFLHLYPHLSKIYYSTMLSKW